MSQFGRENVEFLSHFVSMHLTETHHFLTVGTYSEGNLLVVYEINRQVFPTAPSPTTTHLIVCISVLSDPAGTLAAGRGDNAVNMLGLCS